MKKFAKQLKKLRRHRFSYLPLLAALLSAGFLLLSYYSESWFTDMYVSFAPYVLVGVTLLGIIAFLLTRRDIEKVGVIVLVLLTIGNAVPIYDWLWSKNKSVVSEGDIRIASFNKLYTNNNINEFQEEVNSKNYDIVGLSEVDSEEYDLIRDGWKHSVIADCQCDPAIASELVVLSSLPIQKTEVISAGINDGGLLRVEVRDNDQTVVVYVAHPPAPISKRRFKQRNDVMFDLIIPRLLRDKNKAVVFMGDLNTSGYSRTYQQFSQRLSGYTAVTKGASIANTWCNADFNLPFLCAPIDHIFVSKKLSSTKPDAIIVEGSDHRLISTEIVVK